MNPNYEALVRRIIALEQRLEKMARPEVSLLGHNAVTLAADADTLLGLSDQQLTLDSKAANLIFAGPSSGAATDPTFRSMVSDDLPTNLAVDGNVALDGGIHVGNQAGTCYTDDLVVDGGIAVGHTADQSAGNLTATGDVAVDGGVHVGNKAGTCYTDDLIVDGGIAVGHTADQSAGNVTATGSVKVDGGIYVGDKAGTTYTDDIVVDGGLSVGYASDPTSGEINYDGYLRPYASSTSWYGRALVNVEHQSASTSPTLTTSWQTVNSKAITVPANGWVVAFAHFSSVCTSFSAMQNINCYVYSSPALSGGTGVQYADPTVGYSYEQAKATIVFAGYYTAGGSVTIYQQQKKANSSNTTTGHTETELTILIFR